MIKIASITPCVDDTDYLAATLYSLRESGIRDNLVLINKDTFKNHYVNWKKTEKIALSFNAQVYVGDFGDETMTRNRFLQLLQDAGYKYAFIADGDEVYEPASLSRFINDVSNDPNIQYPVFRTKSMRTYFKYPSYQITPPEPLCPVIMMRTDIRFVHMRNIGKGVGDAVLENLPMHHFSYAKDDKVIKDKIESIFFKNEPIIDNWFEDVFMKWTPKSVDFHPTVPSCYKGVEYVVLPKIITEILEKHGSKWVKEHLKMK